jgi:rubrerythrin
VGAVVEIRTGEDLANFLRKALEIEAGFESVSQWEGYINVKKDEFRDVIFELISESEKHRNLVETMISKIRLSPRSEALPLHPHTFNFKNKTEFEIMMDLSKYEKLAYDTYFNIREALKHSNLDSLIEAKDVPFFFSTLDLLIRGEAEQSDHIANYVGRVERIC